MDEINVKDEIITAVKEAISANTTLAAVDWEPAQLYSDDVDHIAEMVAENLYTAGYRKQNDTAKEILKPLYNVIMEHSECCVNLSEDIKFLMGEYGVNLEDEE